MTEMTTNGSTKMICPKCGAEMDYIIEKEKLGNGEIRIRTYYKCPVCGTMVLDQKIIIERIDGYVKALIENESQVIVRRRNSPKKVSIAKKLKALGILAKQK
jgi:predicted RNA-binding Zn-ribbon protein involved in translation (DUF1610 family)